VPPPQLATRLFLSWISTGPLWKVVRGDGHLLVERVHPLRAARGPQGHAQLQHLLRGKFIMPLTLVCVGVGAMDLEFASL